MGRSIRNKPKNVGGGVSDAQLQTKADTSVVTALQTTVDALSVVEANPTASGTTDLTKLKVGSTTYDIPTATRNYQYKYQTSTDTTTVTSSFLDINGLNGSDALQITTLAANSKIRLHYTIRGELSNYMGNDLLFQLRRDIGGTNTSLNAPTVTNTNPSLAVIRTSVDNENNATMDTWEIYYVDTLSAPAGTTVTYTPQIRFPPFNFNNAVFQLNRTVTASGTHYESSISFAEAEEILTGPPLTTNNVAVPTTNLNNNDVLSYQGGQWTNTAMHTRNYQYKQINDFVTTSYGSTYTDISGFTGSNLLQITTLRANTKIRVHFIIRGESSDSGPHSMTFRLQRRINGGSPTDLNAEIDTTYPLQQPTLANVEISKDADASSTMDTINIYYIDTLDNVSEGSLVSYTPQIRSVGNFNFKLNSIQVNYDNPYYERTLSFSEAEEILTGPPLQINSNVVTATPSSGDFLKWSGSAWVAGYPSIPMARFKFENNTSHYNNWHVLLMANSTERKIAFSFDHNSLNLTYDSSYNFYLPPGKYILTAQIGYRMAQQASSAVNFSLYRGSYRLLHQYTYHNYPGRMNFYLKSDGTGQHDYDAGFNHITISGIIESTSINDAYCFKVFYHSNRTPDGAIYVGPNDSERPLGWIMKVG